MKQHTASSHQTDEALSQCTIVQQHFKDHEPASQKSFSKKMYSLCEAFAFDFSFSVQSLRNVLHKYFFHHPFKGRGEFHRVVHLKLSHYGSNSQNQKAKTVSAGY